MSLLSYLREKIYPGINAGLAFLSRSPGIYTDHGPEHFDEVVRYAGFLLEKPLKDGTEIGLGPYDVFLLLMAIRLHDTGNIAGREHHERRVGEILAKVPNACSDRFEADLVTRIAAAHGGKTEAGSKDTIAELPERDTIGAGPCSPRAIAALVRFADEICEHRGRAAIVLLESGRLPPGNKLFHLYAASIKSAMPHRETKTFKLKLNFDSKNLEKKFPTPLHKQQRPDEHYLLDDAYERIAKLNAERIYCNRFIDPVLRTDRIEAEISIVRQVRIEGQVVTQKWAKPKVVIIEEQGYPEPDGLWKGQLRGMSGSAIAKKLAKEKDR